jgi:hypothetical protein
MRQEENAMRTPLAARLERLRAATGKTWDVLARDLGVKQAMIFHVLSGRRGFSEKSLERLIDSEVAAGVRTKASVLIERGLRAEELIETLIDSDDAGHSKVTVRDVDKGSKKIPLEYRRGSPPPGYPKSATVTAAHNATIWMIIGEKGTREDPSNFLATCLPELQDRPDVLDKLTPSSYRLILETALDLTFGLNWRSKL